MTAGERRDVAHVLVTKLEGLLEPEAPEDGLPTGFVLTFDNFTAGDMKDMERYLPLFRGYRSHRPIDSSPTRQRIWFETAHGASLGREIGRMLDSEGFEAVVSLSGNDFTIEQIGPRRTQR